MRLQLRSSFRHVPHHGTPGDEHGFVLVGVVMFVLALTILGISLFSLSGYEAQFMGASYHKTQSFYDAMGGIERTKYILAATSNLGDAKLNLPKGVIYASALRNGDSTGTLSFSDTSAVRIRVVAERTGERTMLEANYVPHSNRSLYRDLIATPGHIAVYHDDRTGPSAGQDGYEYDNIVGCGHIRNADVGEWLGKILGLVDPMGGGVPVPEVPDFINAWERSGTVAEPVRDTNPHSYRFDLPALSRDSVVYRIFEGPTDSTTGFGLSDTDDPPITFDVVGNVGTAVWLLPAGAYFERPVTVTGDPSSNLIIVAGKGNGIVADTTFSDRTGAELGLWFQGGISSDGPNLFLVSNGTVALDRWRGISHTNSIPFLSVFSGGVYLRGPKGGDGYIRTFEIRHCAGNEAAEDAILDPLFEAGLLPNTLGRSKRLALVPGSFREVTESDPPQ